MRDRAYDAVPYKVSELEHRYGSNVHIVSDPLVLLELARLGRKETRQPELNRLVREIYRHLLRVVVAAEFPRQRMAVPTRMIDHTDRGVFEGVVTDERVRAVTVNIARAGAIPSQVAFDFLNEILDPDRVRQDHLMMARTVSADERVTGAEIGGEKIGGDVEGAFLLFPDPMGATGGSLSRAIGTYKEKIQGKPRRIVNIHLMVTPEYIARMKKDHPEVVIYAARLDRGLSAPDVLETVPGERWAEERGLNDHQYIVPGAGGVGEILNNAYV